MKLLLSITVLLSSLSAFAGPAVCGKYSARVAFTNEKVVIQTQMSEYVNDEDFHGYGTIVTNLVGSKGLILNCRKFFFNDPGALACDVVALKNVKLITDEDCFEYNQR